MAQYNPPPPTNPAYNPPPATNPAYNPPPVNQPYNYPPPPANPAYNYSPPPANPAYNYPPPPANPAYNYPPPPANPAYNYPPPPANPAYNYPPPPANPAYNYPPPPANQPYNYPPPPANPSYNPPPTNPPPSPTPAYTSPPVRQPVVVQQGPAVRSQSNDILGGLGRALDSAAKDISKSISYNPLGLLKSGNIVQLVSKVCGKSLRIVENGTLDCAGDGGTASQFEVISLSSGTHIKLRNVAQPNFYLAICSGYLVGFGQGGTECDFIPAATLDKHITFESTLYPGSHVGVLPSGQLSAPAQTSKMTDASHFTVKFVRTAYRRR